MITDKIQALQKLRAQAAKLEAEVHSERLKELAALPAQYGFETVAEFVKAVSAAASGKGKTRATAKPQTGKRKRALITPAIRDKVAELTKAGKTGAEIAKAVGISLPSVQNIKKAAGLVKARGAKSKAGSSKKS